MTRKDINPYKKLYDGSKLRPLKVVNELLAVELSSKKKDPVLIRYLQHEKRLIFLELFWNDEIDFEMFSKLIKGEAIWLE